MAWRTFGRRGFAAVIGTWTLCILPAVVLTQSQAPPPPPPPVPPGGAVQIRFTAGVANRKPPKFSDLRMPVPAANPMTDEKTALGRKLFFDPILSVDRSVSCATCHLAERAFTDDKPLAIGVFQRVGKRHSPALVNRGFGRSHFWDGRAATLEAQVLLPIADPNEMAMTVEDAVARLAADAAYHADFQRTFSRAVNATDVSYALATYLRTITSSAAPYDRFIDGDTTALSAEAQAGLRIFRTRARCTFCHVEPLFTDEQFHNTGIAWQVDPQNVGAFADGGLYEVSGLDRDRGRFKTPTLREIALTAPYMHDGSLKTLRDVVDFYDQGGRRNPQITPLVRPIRLSEEEKQALVTFLESLTGTVTR